MLDGCCPHDKAPGAVCIPCGGTAVVLEEADGLRFSDIGYDPKAQEQAKAAYQDNEFAGQPVKDKASRVQVGGDHYKNMKIQPSKFIYENGLNWFEGNAVKYIVRHHLKGGRVDLEKAKHYIDLLIEREYG